jgi:hypothetical protein
MVNASSLDLSVSSSVPSSQPQLSCHSRLIKPATDINRDLFVADACLLMN